MKSFLRYVGFLMMVVGVYLFVMLYPHWNSVFSVPFVMNENKFVSERFLCQKTAVDARLIMIMDSFASQTVGGEAREKILGTNKFEYNIVPVFVDNDIYYVSIKLSEEQFMKAKNVIGVTDKYHYGEDVVFEQSFDVLGTLIAMDDDLYDYMKAWFLEMGWLSEEEIGKYVLPLVLEPVDSGTVKTGIYVAVGLIVAGICSVVFAFFIDVKYRRRAKVLRKCQGVIESEQRGKPISIPVKELDDVDKAMWKGNTSKARQLLIKSYKATEEEADDIINRWSELTSPEELKLNL